MTWPFPNTIKRVHTISSAALLIAIILTGGLLLSGCDESSQKPTIESPEFGIQRSQLNRDLTPDVSTSDFNQHIRDNHDYALAFYNQVRDQGEWAGNNLLISPLSMRTAFSQAFAGARGRTETEIAEVLRYSLGQTGTHEATNMLTLALESRNDAGDPRQGEFPIEVKTVNAFWGRQDEVFRADYLDQLAVNYGAAIYTLDYRAMPDAARVIINDWVADQTRNRIEDLLPEGSIDNSTVAVLTNAVYFKAPWRTPFIEDLTAPGQFNLIGGSQVTAEMMNTTENFYYAAGDGYQALELPFRREELGMLFILPATGQLSTLESELDTGRLASIIDALEYSTINVTIPKFSFESAFTMKEMLQQMGMIDPFLETADFTGMLERGGIFIDDAYHKTFIAVDEMGAEAAAATAIVIGETSIPIEEHEFTADRPFLFFIRDRITGAILFMGRVVDPS